jgi:MFS superfamily sulfate permease-like transporter
VGSVTAAVVAVQVAILSIPPQDDTAWLRDLFWPDRLTPYITFSLVCLGVLTVLLGYFHLGRLGAFVSLGVGFALAWLMAVCAIVCFVRLSSARTVWLGELSYGTCLLVVYLSMFYVHMKATKSRWIVDAQRKMHLLQPLATP